ncbi:MAG: hypothetical protein OXU61_02495 [Gammaproteobacteria bacterium]|nr:hypothetical protein [Gammaproteobacteria bacterium]
MAVSAGFWRLRRHFLVIRRPKTTVRRLCVACRLYAGRLLSAGGEIRLA